jgi:hypothetical protein
MIYRLLVAAFALLVLAGPVRSQLDATGSIEQGLKLFEAEDYAGARTNFEGVLMGGDNHEACYYLGRIALS